MTKRRSKSTSDDIVRYKTILQTVIESRPSGTKQRLATALGTNRSFITQITSPVYLTPIPEQHLQTIFSICRFSPEQIEQFQAAYYRVHPRQDSGGREQRVRVRQITIPDLGDAEKNEAVDRMVDEFARNLRLLTETMKR